MGMASWEHKDICAAAQELLSSTFSCRSMRPKLKLWSSQLQTWQATVGLSRRVRAGINKQACPCRPSQEPQACSIILAALMRDSARTWVGVSSQRPMAAQGRTHERDWSWQPFQGQQALTTSGLHHTCRGGGGGGVPCPWCHRALACYKPYHRREGRPNICRSGIQLVRELVCATVSS